MVLPRLDLEPNWHDVRTGDNVRFLADVIIWDGQTGKHLCRSALARKFVVVYGSLPNVPAISFLDAKVTGTTGGFRICCDAATLLPHVPSQPTAFGNVVEGCCGIGCLGDGMLASGFQVIASNDLSSPLCQWMVRNGRTNVVHGNLGDAKVLQQMHMAHQSSTTVAGGFSCQPWSQLGDKNGVHDARAASIVYLLQAMYFTRAHSGILECVCAAGSDSTVQALLAEFCRITGFQHAQVNLSLSDLCPAKRDRWWCVLTSSGIPQVNLTPLPRLNPLPTFGDIFETIPQWPDADVAQLALDQYETGKFEAFGGLSKNYIRQDEPLRTALHGFGNQLSACPCQCRSWPMSEARLQERGLFGALILLNGFHETHRWRLPKTRHVHPVELAIVHGASPKKQWHPNLKLSLHVCPRATCQPSAELLGQCTPPSMFWHSVGQPSDSSGSVFVQSLFIPVPRCAGSVAAGFLQWTIPEVLRSGHRCFAGHSKFFRDSQCCLLFWPFKRPVNQPTDRTWEPENCDGWTRKKKTASDRDANTREHDETASGWGARTHHWNDEDSQTASEWDARTHNGWRSFERHPCPCDPCSCHACATIRVHRPLPGCPPCWACSWTSRVQCCAQRCRSRAGDNTCLPCTPCYAFSGTSPCWPFPCLYRWPNRDSVWTIAIKVVFAFCSWCYRWFASICIAHCAQSLWSPCFEAAYTDRRLWFWIGPSTCDDSPGSFTQDLAEAVMAMEHMSDHLEQDDIAPTAVEPEASPDPEVSGLLTDPSTASPTKDVAMHHVQVFRPETPQPSLLLVPADATIASIEAAEFRLNNQAMFRTNDAVGCLLRQAEQTSPFQQLHFRSLDSYSLLPGSSDQPLLLQSQDPCTRQVLLDHQEAWVAVDEMHHYLDMMASNGFCKVVPPCVVPKVTLDDELIDVMQAWEQKCTDALRSATRVVTALLVDQHWFPFYFISAPFGVKTCCCPDGADWLRVAMQDRWNPDNNIKVPVAREFTNDCGFQTVAWLVHMLSLETWPTPDTHVKALRAHEAVAWRTLFSHFLKVQGFGSHHVIPANVRFGGAGKLDVHALLTQLLQEHGVPQENAHARADMVLTQLGRSRVAQILRSQHAWRDLKSAASNASPKIQLVLGHELDEVIANRVRSDKPFGGKKVRASGTKGSQGSQIMQPLPADVQVPEGIFRDAGGSALQQISLSSIGPQAKGVIVMSIEQATPYLKVSKPVSANGLAILIVDHTSTLLHGVGQEVRFPAIYGPTAEPMLLTVKLVQIGSQEVMRNLAQEGPKVEEVKNAVVKVLAYKDEIELPWTEFTLQPVKEIIKMTPGLQAKDCILDVWDRQYLVSSHGFQLSPQPCIQFVFASQELIFRLWCRHRENMVCTLSLAPSTVAVMPVSSGSFGSTNWPSHKPWSPCSQPPSGPALFDQVTDLGFALRWEMLSKCTNCTSPTCHSLTQVLWPVTLLALCRSVQLGLVLPNCFRAGNGQPAQCNHVGVVGMVKEFSGKSRQLANRPMKFINWINMTCSFLPCPAKGSVRKMLCHVCRGQRVPWRLWLPWKLPLPHKQVTLWQGMQTLGSTGQDPKLPGQRVSPVHRLTWSLPKLSTRSWRVSIKPSLTRRPVTLTCQMLPKSSLWNNDWDVLKRKLLPSTSSKQFAMMKLMRSSLRFAPRLRAKDWISRTTSTASDKNNWPRSKDCSHARWLRSDRKGWRRISLLSSPFPSANSNPPRLIAPVALGSCFPRSGFHGWFSACFAELVKQWIPGRSLVLSIATDFCPRPPCLQNSPNLLCGVSLRPNSVRILTSMMLSSGLSQGPPVSDSVPR